MCMSKGVPKRPEYGPCQESHGLPAQIDLKTLGDHICFISFFVVMASVIQQVADLYKQLATSP